MPQAHGLQEGDRLFCGPHGHYTLHSVGRDVVFAGTGTGEAPHNAMLAELLATGHRGQIACVTCARWKKDLGYAQIHGRVSQRFQNYRYLSLTTRERENVDPTSAGYVGKRYLQEYFGSGDFERDAGFSLDPLTTHFFVCGSPEMIGVPRHTHDPSKRYPRPKGLVEVLKSRSFCVDQPHEPGNIHFEKYW